MRLNNTVVPMMLLATLFANLAASEERLDPERVAFFEAKVRPVLVKHCYACHSAEAGKALGSLLLDSRHGVRTGGDRGPAVVPGKPEDSWLLTAMSHSDPDLSMPPNRKKLSADIVSDIRRWIKDGAVDPRANAKRKHISSIDYDEARKFWSYHLSKPEPLPKATSWSSQPIDRFIARQLAKAGLAPSPDAPPAVLARRLYFDLIGLPPSPAEVRSFVESVKKEGIEKALSDRADLLLASPQYAERWGRHWLDVARFAESSGKESNVSFPHAWRYRNYVIDAFHQDKPYDRFITEQLAGDLLPAASDKQRARLLIATSFLAFGPKGLNEMNKVQFRADLVDEQIDTVSRAIMATSVACARCHDHKYDPFSMTDYYALAGIFASTRTYFGTSVAPGNQMGGDLIELPNLPSQLIPNKSLGAKRVKTLKQELVNLAKEEKERKIKAREAAAKGEDPNKHFSIADALRILWRRGAIEGQLKTVDAEGKALPLTMGVRDQPKIANARLLERGEIQRPGETVPRRFPNVFVGLKSRPIGEKQSGRLELARWLTDPAHPLTARVMANRIWKHLLGEGIVRTVDNFGVNGEQPTHPELLNYLGRRFVEKNWSIKSLVKEIVLSRTYRQSSSFAAKAYQKDPDNRLIWRVNKRRLDAESIRDAMLTVSGELDRSRPESSLVAKVGNRPISIFMYSKGVPADLDGVLHRSVYLPVLRDKLPDILELFDFAEPSLVTGRRDTTNVPLQALYMMNSPFVRARAEGLAKRLGTKSNVDDTVVQAYQICFSRKPDSTELKMGRSFLLADSKVVEKDRLTSYCHALLTTAEFRNLD